jgi:arylsulfatase
MGLFAFALASLFILLEVLKAHRHFMWAGSDLAAWVGVAIAYVAYGSALLIISLAVAFLASRTPLARLHASTRLLLAATIAALGVWGILSVHREFFPTKDDAVVTALVVGFLVAGWMAAGRSHVAFRVVCIVFMVACASAVIGIAGASNLFMLAPDRGGLAMRLGIAWMALGATCSCVLSWGIVHKHRSSFVFGLVMSTMLVLASAGFYVAPGSETSHEATAKPNIIFIVADALRADYLEPYGGSARHPALQKMASEGALFERCYAMAPWTPPSMSALFNAEYPPSLDPSRTQEDWQNDAWRYRIDKDRQTLPERLSDAGYATGALMGNPAVHGMRGMHRGYQQTVHTQHLAFVRSPRFALLPFSHDAIKAIFPNAITDRLNDSTAALTRYGLTFLRDHQEQPFFLWMHYMDPHDPYDPPARFRTRTGPWPVFCPFPPGDQWGCPQLTGDFVLSEDERAYVQSLYEGETRYLDESIGKILGELERLGLSENTYICFTSDHGEELWDRDDWGHGQTLYEEQLRVPFIVKGPGVVAQKVGDSVSLIHMMRTLAEWAAVDPDPAWKGESLAPMLREVGESVPDEPSFAQATILRAKPEPLQAVIDGEDKLIRGVASGDIRLYKLAEDPDELSDVASRYVGRAQALQDTVVRWLDTFPSILSEPAEDDSAPQVSEEAIETLRSMGYLE